MRIIRVISALALGALWAPAATPVKFPEVYPPQNDVAVDHRVATPMRDGVILYADVYRPLKSGKYPVIVSRTPYSTERAPAAYEEPLFYARRGYVFVIGGKW